MQHQKKMEIDELTGKVHALASAGHFGEALSTIHAALAEIPDDAEFIFSRASVYFDWGRFREARLGYLQAESMGIARHDLFLNIAWSNHLLGNPQDAERYLRMALDVDAQSLPAQTGLGVVLQSRDRFAEAVAAYKAVLALAPERSDCLLNIAACHLDQGLYAEAEDWARRAVALAPDSPACWVMLGSSLAQQDQFAPALEALRHAHSIENTNGAGGETFATLAYWLLASGQPEAALQMCASCLPAQPNPAAHAQYAFALLTAGQFRQGWEQYEFRWFQDPLRAKRAPWIRPVWAGQDLADKVLLLLAEQGVGDTIQTVRYAAVFKSMGARVVVQVPSDFCELTRQCSGVDKVISSLDAPPPFDYYLHMMSAPRALGTELNSVPAEVPYLHPDAEKISRWSGVIPTTLPSIGFAWAGNPKHLRDRHRSMLIEDIAPLWDGGRVRFFSLQKELTVAHKERLALAGIKNLGPDFGDFCDTAAAIANLDLVICVDTSVAHVAGALGRPAWVLLPFQPDWRWTQDRDRSPWYPEVRLFRQPALGDWERVIAQIRDELAKY